MGNNISDVIEQYLKGILQQADSGMVELQRSELAELFQCVPSQINYVISTRFSVDHGYLVESKRGGGGYIRIRTIQLHSENPLMGLLHSIGELMTQREAEALIDRITREQIVSKREAAILRSVISRDALALPLPLRDELRSRLMTQMLLALVTGGQVDL